MTEMIEFDRVSIVFGGDPARALPLMDRGQSRSEIQKATGQVLGVHDCSLTVARGEISVLMGLSGSGKSTLLRAVNGLNPVARGRVLVRGNDETMVDVVTCDADKLRALRRGAVSMVFQQFALLPWRSVVENVALGLELAGEPKEKRLAKAREVLATVNLQDWAEKKVSELSGGMQQRVGLARAFATDAEILLDGRAVLGARPADPQPAAGRAVAAAGEDALHDRLRLPRPRGGGEARQHHHHHGGRADRADRAGRRTSCSGRRTAMSRISWRISIR